MFGPRPRDYRFKLNKKLKQLARKSVLTTKVQADQIKIVEDFTFEAPKTKDFVNFTKNFKLEGEKVLVVFADQNKNVYLSARNVPGAKLMTASDLNTYALLNNKAIILTESGLDVVNKF